MQFNSLWKLDQLSGWFPIELTNPVQFLNDAYTPNSISPTVGVLRLVPRIQFFAELQEGWIPVLKV